MRALFVVHVLISFAVIATCGSSNAQVPTGAATEVDQGRDAPRSLAEQRYAQFAMQANELDFTIQRGEQRLTLREQPLQTFSSEGNTFGSVVLWQAADGRPAVIGTLGSLPINGRDFGFIELHWLLTEPIKPITVGKNYPKLWRADGQNISLQPIDDGPAPAETAAARLLQMRNLARSFTAAMTEGENHHHLRLLPQPLYRYEDNSKDKDGAIFAFVWTIGTDPEVLLHLHSREQDGELKWYWQPIRFTWRAVELAYKNQTVWQVEEFFGRNAAVQTGPYLTTLTEPLE